MAAPGKYEKLIQVLLEHHVVELFQYLLLRDNGMFGVPKDVKMTRLNTNAGDTNRTPRRISRSSFRIH